MKRFIIKTEMRTSYTIIRLIFWGSVIAPSYALANLELAKKNACMSCHAVDKKLVGPAFREVSQKYAKMSDPAVQLAQSIKKGGAGKWGPVPMPPPAALTEAEAVVLAKWIVEGAK